MFLTGFGEKMTVCWWSACWWQYVCDLRSKILDPRCECRKDRSKKSIFIYVKFDARTCVHAHKYVHVPVQALAGGEVDVCCGVFTCLYVGEYYVLILYFRNCFQKKKKKKKKKKFSER